MSALAYPMSADVMAHHEAGHLVAVLVFGMAAARALVTSNERVNLNLRSSFQSRNRARLTHE